MRTASPSRAPEGLPLIREAVPAYRPGVAGLPESSQVVVLVARVSNYDYRVGGMWRAFVMGKADALSRQLWASVTGDLALASSLAVLGLIFAFFIRMSGAGKAFACFSAFAFAAALRSLLTEDYAIVDLFPNLGFGDIVRLEYLSVFSIFPLSFLFHTLLFPEEIETRLSLALLVLCAAFLALVPFAPLRILTMSIVLRDLRRDNNSRGLDTY
jgi:hypothetical protein